jgi:glycolate oxidase iron-sulfur subunit
MRGEPGQVPSSDTRLQALADECVMCGLCLPHCPTFRLSGLEAHSPRGRIALARTLTPGRAADESVRAALESCLQCRACESVCPAQVRYGEIIEGARAVLRQTGPPAAKLTELAARRPRIAATMLSLAGRVARVWPMATRHLGRRARWLLRAGRAVEAQPRGRATVVLFSGCVARAFDSQAQHALLRVARTMAVDLRPLQGQGCCGAMARHVGATVDADTQAARLRQQWEDAGTREVVALDSGCIHALRRAAGDRVRIVEGCRWLLDRRSEWLRELRPIPARVGWFAPCSHRNVVGDAAAAGELLALLPGVEVIPVATGLGCCGAAGPHLLAHPRQADALARPIVDAIAALQLDAVATSNVGCALHLQERLTLRSVTLSVRHPVAFLVDRLPNQTR